jgi:peroxiredoxin
VAVKDSPYATASASAGAVVFSCLLYLHACPPRSGSEPADQRSPPPPLTLCCLRLPLTPLSALTSPRRDLPSTPCHYLAAIMVLKRSNKSDLPQGSFAPPFSLLEPLSGKTVRLADAAGQKGTLVAFLSCHCPFVVHIQGTVRTLSAELRALGIETLAVSSNDIATYPEDAPEHMAALARGPLKGVTFLFDESQEIAKAYKAQCTPDFYLFDADLKLVYRGRIDGSTPGNGVPSDGGDMLAAAKALSEGSGLDWSAIQPSMGCSIKWKRGNAPDY